MKLIEFNKLNKETAAEELFSCCGSVVWVSLMMKHFPFASEKDLVGKATNMWYQKCSAADWLESFTHHPKIGDVKSLKEKFAGLEQAGVAVATHEVITALANANAEYENKFGFIFIVCATGRTAAEMLYLLQHRLKNSIEEELNIAMGEQHKITIIRFQKLITETHFQLLTMSQLTTHVLDTSIGKPANGVIIRLMHRSTDNPLAIGWQTIAQGITDTNGRLDGLLPPEKKLTPGIYKLVFETGNYFAAHNTTGFYPEVEIQFKVFDDTHYHVPLLINPFGYSTYRGS